MLEALENFQQKGIYISVLTSIVFIFLSGLFFGFTYYIMDTTHTAFQSADCVIVDNALVGSCQDLFSIALYPFLVLKSVLIFSSFFFIFGLVLAMLILGYRSGSSPVLIGLNICFVGLLTYGAILMSNIYRMLIGDAVIRSMLVEFTVYNKIMLNFPIFTFFVGLFSVMLGIVNYQKSSVNTPEGEQLY